MIPSNEITPHPRHRACAVGLALWLGAACTIAAPVVGAAAGSTEGQPGSAIQQTAFATPEAAAEALIAAAESFDIPALTEILGPDGVDLVTSEDPVNDRKMAAEFVAEARTATRIERDPENPSVAIVSVGAYDWPLPVPLVEHDGAWRFDIEAGYQEVLYRRVGRNELDAIEVCRGYVEAQHEYAFVKHDGALVNQYAQRIISTPGTQDGLAWRASDGTWHGPVGEGIARAIAEGYTERFEPFHGYYFKVLKGQSPNAPLGELDFVVDGAMIGGFALVAAPADYGETGVMTFIVSHDGVVYEKDLGPATFDEFRAMELYDPDETWTPVHEE